MHLVALTSDKIAVKIASSLLLITSKKMQNIPSRPHFDYLKISVKNNIKRQTNT